MKRQVQLIGGDREYYGDDFIELQHEPLKALDTVIEEYGQCILQGCRITATANDRYDVTDGLVALKNRDTNGVERIMVMPFIGILDVELPLYITGDYETELRIYGDGQVMAVSYDYIATASITVPTPGVPNLIITAQGDANRFVDAIQDEEHQFIRNNERTNWNGIPAVAKEYADTALEDKATLVTESITEQTNTALTGKAALIPHSTTEQIVPGEFWIGPDSVSRQVYQKTFVGTTPATIPPGQTAAQVTLIPTSLIIREFRYVTGGIDSYKYGFVYYVLPNDYNPNASSPNDFYYTLLSTHGGVLVGELTTVMLGRTYSITLQYTKL